jgi:recombination protein RecR
MTKMPKAITELAAILGALPGIGPKSANRLAVYMATNGQNNAENLQRILSDVKSQVRICKLCGNLSEEALCDVCADSDRDQKTVMVVETPMDLLQVEQTGEYNGAYLVLGRLISPINGIGPDSVNIASLNERLQGGGIEEIILALTSTVEGEATGLYISNLVRDAAPDIKVSKLARGLPTGVGIEYLDKETLKGALEGRRESN